MLDVITAVDPLRRIKHCPLGIKAHSTTPCPLHRKLDDAIRSVEEAFASTTIGELRGLLGSLSAAMLALAVLAPSYDSPATGRSSKVFPSFLCCRKVSDLRWDVVGAGVCLVGAAVILFGPTRTLNLTTNSVRYRAATDGGKGTRLPILQWCANFRIDKTGLTQVGPA